MDRTHIRGRRPTNLIGREFPDLTVIRQLEETGRSHTYWRCLCECGNMCTVRSQHLIKRRVRSCGQCPAEITTIMVTVPVQAAAFRPVVRAVKPQRKYRRTPDGRRRRRLRLDKYLGREVADARGGVWTVLHRDENKPVNWVVECKTCKSAKSVNSTHVIRNWFGRCKVCHPKKVYVKKGCWPKPGPRDKARAREIVARLEARETLQEIADTLGVTRERVRQIALSQGVRPTGNERRKRDHTGEVHNGWLVQAKSEKGVYTFACQTCQATKKDRAISATNKSCFKCRMKKSDEENDLTGRHFGDDENDGWTVICFAGRNKQYRGQRMWLCRCVCGIEKLVSAANLVSGKSKRCHSCGQKLWRKKKCERLEREVTNAVIIPS